MSVCKYRYVVVYVDAQTFSGSIVCVYSIVSLGIIYKKLSYRWADKPRDACTG